MKKTTNATTTKATDFDKELRASIHELWEEANDAVEKLELDSYVDDENMPRVKAMDESDTIDVGDVLLIGGYMALNKVHQLIHESDAKRVGKQVDDVFAGKLEFEAIIPKGMPKELADLLTQLVDVSKKTRKKLGDK